MVINFLVLVGLLYFAGRKTVERFLRDRRDRLMASIDEASRMKKEAEERHADYSGRLERIKDEEQRIRDELVTAAVKEKERLVADAGARAEKMRSEARTLVDREQAEASFVLRRETAGRAVDVARSILEQRIGPGEHRKLVDEYMRLLESQVKT
jgi:F-type H+-transporting ATPase subunit b